MRSSVAEQGLTAERFERRLAEELSMLRVEIAESQARLQAGVSKDLQRGLAGVREDIATARVELFKWSFLFWVGQVAVIAGLLSFMLRDVAR